jgi:uncharacterized Tic20 family protein
MTDNPGVEQTGPGVEDRIRIPVDGPVLDMDKADAHIEQMVREYESKYSGFRDSEPPKIKNKAYAPFRPSAPIYATTQDERNWAAMAHGSALITLFLGLMSGGALTLFTVFIPLAIYFYYRQRSEYVAYQALQAFVLQLLGTIGWVSILTAGMLAGGLLMLVLAITIIGIPVAIIVGLAMILFAVVSLALPFGMVLYGTIAAWETNQGKWYRYPWIGDWVDRQMHAGFLATL